MLTFDQAQKQAHKIAIDNGFYDEQASNNVHERFMLMVTELAEACEAARKPFNPSKDMVPGHSYQLFLPDYYLVDDKPEGMFVELADCIIRILDFAEHNKVDIGELVSLKMAYNRTRPYRHGGKRA